MKHKNILIWPEKYMVLPQPIEAERCLFHPWQRYVRLWHLLTSAGPDDRPQGQLLWSWHRCQMVVMWEFDGTRTRI